MKRKIGRDPPKVTTLIGMALVSSLVRGAEERRAAVEGAQLNMASRRPWSQPETRRTTLEHSASHTSVSCLRFFSLLSLSSSRHPPRIPCSRPPFAFFRAPTARAGALCRRDQSPSRAVSPGALPGSPRLSLRSRAGNADFRSWLFATRHYETVCIAFRVPSKSNFSHFSKIFRRFFEDSS